MDTISTLNKERGVTILVITHDSKVAAYGKRVVNLIDGQINSDDGVN